MSTRVIGTASYFRTGDKKNSTGFGSTNQVLEFGGLSNAGQLGPTPDVTLYSRNVTAINQTIVLDHEIVAGGQEKVMVAIVDSTDTGHASLVAYVPFRGSRFTGAIRSSINAVSDEED